MPDTPLVWQQTDCYIRIKFDMLKVPFTPFLRF